VGQEDEAFIQANGQSFSSLRQCGTTNILSLTFPLKLKVETCEILSLLLEHSIEGGVMTSDLEASAALERQQLLGRNGPTMNLHGSQLRAEMTWV
jgi:hypothetical protein